MTFHTIGLFVTNNATGWMAKVARKMLITGIYFLATCLWIPYTTKPCLKD